MRTPGLVFLHGESVTGHGTPRYTQFVMQPPKGVPLRTLDWGTVFFQDGPVREHGLNGIQTEDLIELALERMKIHQQQAPCPENALTIDALQTAIDLQEGRRRERQQRGVEGTSRP